MVNTIENIEQNPAEMPQARISISQGYFPIPILFIPPENLSNLKLYTANSDGNLHLYLKDDAIYLKAHKEFLLKKGVRYLYLKVEDFNDYLKAVNREAEEILVSRDLDIAEKCELTYAILLALAKRTMSADINRSTFVEVLKVCKNITPLFHKHKDFYKYFYNIMLRDYDHATHAANMSVTITSFAKKIGINDEKMLTHCCSGGILHDIGKRFVPSDILDSPKKLSDIDLEVVQGHVIEAINAIEKYSKLPPKVMNIISEHHETIDGEGYPKRLKDKQISIFGRMACITDMFNAMTCQRPYRQHTMSADQAIAEIKGLAGLKVDKTVAGSFAQFIDHEIRNASASDDYFDGLILDELGLTPEIGANPSGRRHERFYFRTKVRISRLTRKNDKWILTDPKELFCSNMSVSGLALIYNRKHELNQMVRVELEMPEDYPEKVQAIGKIVRCVDNGGTYTLGIEFLKYMDSDKVQDIYNTLK